MKQYAAIQTELKSDPRRWCVTGVAGFIGSHILESLLTLDQYVVGIDNFETGAHTNLSAVKENVSSEQWQRFQFIESDINDEAKINAALKGVNIILHQAALGSVPLSIEKPEFSHQANVNGFFTLINAAKRGGIKRFVYASSSAVYGDDETLPKLENKIGKPLSPYAAQKRMNEEYADCFASAYAMETIGLRYFNVFGARQNPNGAYAAVIPNWIAKLQNNEAPVIYGDGKSTRDFCYIDDVVQANILAGTTDNSDALNQVYNIGVGVATNLNQLLEAIQEALKLGQPALQMPTPLYKDKRAGDIVHSVADISRAQRLLGFQPEYSLLEGLTAGLHGSKNEENP